MARPHFVKKARKDNPVVKRGESYYWWQFRFGPKMYSKDKPARSQLTQSEFLSTLYSLQDHNVFGNSTVESIQGDVECFVEDLQNLLEMCEDSLNNMPEHLQDASAAGETLTERIDNLETWINDLENVDLDLESKEDDENFDEDEWLQTKQEELRDTDCHF